MINAYKEGKDLYATIASGVYNNTYWDNMEFTDETKTVANPEGKKRRSSVKSLLLGIMYGRGVASIAEQINGTIKDAQKIVDDFYKGFPKVKKWMDETQTFAKTYGYVEDLWGRRRRLPDIQLPRFECINIISNQTTDCNESKKAPFPMPYVLSFIFSLYIILENNAINRGEVYTKTVDKDTPIVFTELK